MRVEITGVNTATLKRMPNKEMMVLLEKVKKGDTNARDELFKVNIRLILSILKKFKNRNESMDDLFQVGAIGLLKAIDNFDTKYNVMFSTYAVPMIIGEIKRHLRDSQSVKVSRSLKDIAYKVLIFKEKYIQKYQKEPTIKEISLGIDVEQENVIVALEACQDTISMYTPIYNNNGDNIELIDQIATKEDIIINFSKEDMLKKSIKKLPKREKSIIYDRYFNNKTQTEIAEEIGISQAQVSRLEKNALKRMYKEINS